MFLKIISSISTNNFQDPNMMEKISHLWQEHQKEVEEVFAQGLPIYAVYHDYVSDYKGDYSLSLCSLSDKEDWDFDTSGQTYQVFEVDTSDSKGHLIPGNEFGKLKKRESYNVSIVLILKNMNQTRQYLSLSLPLIMGELSICFNRVKKVS